MSFRYAEEFGGSSSQDIPLASTSTSRLPDLPLVKQQQQKENNSTLKSKRNRSPIVIDDDDDDDEDEEEFGADFEEQDEEDLKIDQEDDAEGTLEEEEEECLQKLNGEISQIESQILQLQSLRATLTRERSTLSSSINSRNSSRRLLPTSTSTSKPKPIKGAVNYVKGKFDWDERVKKLAKEVWQIDEFRLCQRAVINASLDGNDIVVIMPTGGGKSLTYQLPALLAPGTSIVITPLISLMQDQVWNLKDHGVKAEMLNASSDKGTAKDIHARMLEGLKEGKEREIKLVYVTPERIEKSKTFVSILQKLYDNNSLSRIIVDEAHCISTLGNDFRTSYKSLGRLRTLFSSTPIIALTATAPPVVIKDMLKSLQMSQKTSRGESGLPNTSIIFTSPLYRSNLHYSVMFKPTAATAVIELIVNYIRKKHAKECGIIYCLSRTDTENVAKGISKEGIRCAVYHAGIDDTEKVRIHHRWRKGDVHVIVATNAFGLGIDAPNVRFVIHHSISKSLESYYQESGRAGRDGLNSDCVALFRSADATRLSTLIYADFANSGKKLYEMVSYAEDLEICRKIGFALYFTSTGSRGAFEEGKEAEEVCGHCDNCTRDPDSFSETDITDQVYKALRILAGTRKTGVVPTLTLTQACDLVRGNGGGKFSTQETKGKGEGRVNIEEEAGGKVTLTKDQTESMLLLLLVKGYLKEQFHATAYNTISYLNSTSLAARFTRFTPEGFSQLEHPHKITMNILDGKKKKRKSSTTDNLKPPKKQKVVIDESKKERNVKKGKSKMLIEDSEDEEEEGGGGDDQEDIEAIIREAEEYDDNDDDDDGDSIELDADGWQVLRAHNSEVMSGKKEKNVEVLDLVDDSD